MMSTEFEYDKSIEKRKYCVTARATERFPPLPSVRVVRVLSQGYYKVIAR